MLLTHHQPHFSTCDANKLIFFKLNRTPAESYSSISGGKKKKINATWDAWDQTPMYLLFPAFTLRYEFYYISYRFSRSVADKRTQPRKVCTFTFLYLRIR